MKKRTIRSHEQPNVFVRGLQNATVLNDGTPAKSQNPAEVGAPAAAGVPHGVTNAAVHIRNVRVSSDQPGDPEFFFCEVDDVTVSASTIRDGDHHPYPDGRRSRISVGCRIPASGYYTARGRICVNGTTDFHVEQLTPEDATVGV